MCANIVEILQNEISDKGNRKRLLNDLHEDTFNFMFLCNVDWIIKGNVKTSENDEILTEFFLFSCL